MVEGAGEGAGASATLRRAISLPWLVLYGLGTTIGAGIYALTGVVAGRAGMRAPFCFLLASSIALFTALSFAELSSRFPRAGGEAVYVREGFAWPGLSTAVGVLIVLAGLISAATVSVAFVGYLQALVPLPRLPVTAAVVLLLGAVAGWGVRQSVTLAGVLTLVEVGGLLAIVAYGAEHLAALPQRLGEMLPLDGGAWRAVAGTAILAFYAYLGFEDMVNVAEEVRDAPRVMPVAIVLTLAATTLLYVLVSAVAVLAVAPEELGASPSPLALVFARCGGPAPLLGVIALFALLNGALVQVIKASRVLYGLAAQGSLPARLGRVHRRTRTPLFATLLATLFAALMAVSLPLATLAATTSVITLVTFALANLALVRLKRRGPAPAAATSFPLWVPLLGFALSAGFACLELAGRLGRG
jgi:APA family basic amino acid/polyamine antiporter